MWPHLDSPDRGIALDRSHIEAIAALGSFEVDIYSYGTLDGYLSSLIDGPSDAFPINRLAREAVKAAEQAHRGSPRHVADDAVGKALLGTLTRYHFALRADVQAHETVDRRCSCSPSSPHSWRSSSTSGLTDGRRAPQTEGWRKARDGAFLHVDAMVAMAEARSAIEKRFLRGHPVLFPAVADEWVKCLRHGQPLAVMADELPQENGLPAFEPPSDEQVRDQVAAATAALLEPARAMALADLDEGSRAFSVARTWVRSTLAAGADRPASEPAA